MCYDVDQAATAKLANQRLDVVVCDSASEATQGADIVTTVTADKTNAIILTPDMITPGMRVNAVGGDHPGKTELHESVLTRGNVFVEYKPQTCIEGDIQQMAPDFPVTELWQVLSETTPGRKDTAEITVFDSVGFALEDYSALTFIRDTAQEFGVGDIVELIPETTDDETYAL